MNRRNNTTNVSSNEKKDFKGKRLPHFSYTNKEVLSISKFIKKMEEEMKRVRDLQNGRIAGWIESVRPEGTTYHEDVITEIAGVGAKTRNDLAIAGVFKIKDLIFPLEVTIEQKKEPPLPKNPKFLSNVFTAYQLWHPLHFQVILQRKSTTN